MDACGARESKEEKAVEVLHGKVRKMRVHMCRHTPEFESVQVGGGSCVQEKATVRSRQGTDTTSALECRLARPTCPMRRPAASKPTGDSVKSLVCKIGIMFLKRGPPSIKSGLQAPTPFHSMDVALPSAAPQCHGELLERLLAVHGHTLILAVAAASQEGQRWFSTPALPGTLR